MIESRLKFGLIVTASFSILTLFLIYSLINMRMECQSLNCLLTSHPSATKCPPDVWECLVSEQVKIAPPFVTESLNDYLSTQGWQRPNAHSKATATIVAHPTQNLLYVSYYREDACDDIGSCLNREGILLQYTPDGWSIVDAPVKYSGAEPCPDSYEYYLYGIQQDLRLYYGRVNVNRNACVNDQDRNIMRLDTAGKTIYRNQTAVLALPTP